MKTLNQVILNQLKSAPNGQISSKVRERVLSCKDEPEAIRDLFLWIYQQPNTERSSFVAQMVNPEFILHQDYMYKKV